MSLSFVSVTLFLYSTDFISLALQVITAISLIIGAVKVNNLSQGCFVELEHFFISPANAEFAKLLKIASHRKNHLCVIEKKIKNTIPLISWEHFGCCPGPLVVRDRYSVLMNQKVYL